MSKNSFTISYKVLTGSIFAILLTYVILRAYLLSFTHDESLSFTIINGDTQWRGTANNHLLNTLLMSINKMLFGASEFSLRLPNVLSFIGYLTGCFLIFSKSEKIWLSLFALVILLINPFLLEFFSLARGYGLSLGFMILSIYFLIRNNIDNQTSQKLLKDFVLSSLFAGLSIYSSLTLINFYICVLIIFGVKYWLFKKKEKTNSKFNRQFWGVFSVSSIPLLLGIFRLLKLKSSNQLYFGASSLGKGFDSLMYSSINLGEYTSLAIVLIKVLFVSSLLISTIYIIRKKKYYGALFILTTVIVILTLGLLLEDILFGAKYPTSRTALFYIPIIGVFVYHLSLDLVKQYNIKTKYYVPVVLFFISVITMNFTAKANLEHTTSWRYDAQTKNVMSTIKQYSQNTKENSEISNHWLFEPTINYYINLWKLNLNPANRDGINLNSDFIYRLDDEKELSKFKIISSYDEINSELLIKTSTNTSMERKLINSNSFLENEIGYSRAVVQGDWIFVSGTSGFEYSKMTIPEDIVSQTEQCLNNIASALKEADSKMEDIVRVTYIVPEASEFEKCWPVLKKYFGEIKPAATMFSAKLADSRMKIEIQVTALKK